MGHPLGYHWDTSGNPSETKGQPQQRKSKAKQKQSKSKAKAKQKQSKSKAEQKKSKANPSKSKVRGPVRGASLSSTILAKLHGEPPAVGLLWPFGQT